MAAPRAAALTVCFRRSGWQWPFREGDTLRVLDLQAHVLVEVPAALVRELVQHYLTAATLQTTFADHLTGPTKPHLPESPPRPSPRPRLPAARGRRLRGRAPMLG